jgi:photosystem II stability/assembly factor-like uncharacterized protein
MAWRTALVCCALVAASGAALANGRPPATSSITFRQGMEREIAVGLTFGLLVSRDGGQSWTWMCEEAIPSPGTYDPTYGFSSTGALFASTLAGFKVMRDSCTFGGTPAGATFVSTNVFGPDRTLYYAAGQAADPPHGIVADFRIYRSSDDGATATPTAGQPSVVLSGAVSWWETLAVAPSDPLRLYLSGYHFKPNPAGPGTIKDHFVYRTDNGGVSWQPLPVTDFTIAANSVIEIVGISRTQPDHAYARVKVDDNQVSDSIYRSTDKGATWQRINRKGSAIPAFLVRANGDLILGTPSLGAEISRDNGDTWTPLLDAPHMSCLAENSAGEIWACTQNYGRPDAPSDDAGIMKTTDLVTWTKVLRFQDLTDAAICPAGTVQHEKCASMWCTVCMQLGCSPSAASSCAGDTDAPPPPPAKAGCCNSREGAGALALGLAVGTLLLRPRRRREHR